MGRKLESYAFLMGRICYRQRGLTYGVFAYWGVYSYPTYGWQQRSKPLR